MKHVIICGIGICTILAACVGTEEVHQPASEEFFAVKSGADSVSATEGLFAISFEYSDTVTTTATGELDESADEDLTTGPDTTQPTVWINGKQAGELDDQNRFWPLTVATNGTVMFGIEAGSYLIEVRNPDNTVVLAENQEIGQGKAYWLQRFGTSTNPSQRLMAVELGAADAQTRVRVLNTTYSGDALDVHVCHTAEDAPPTECTLAATLAAGEMWDQGVSAQQIVVVNQAGTTFENGNMAAYSPGHFGVAPREVIVMPLDRVPSTDEHCPGCTSLNVFPFNAPQ